MTSDTPTESPASATANLEKTAARSLREEFEQQLLTAHSAEILEEEEWYEIDEGWHGDVAFRREDEEYVWDMEVQMDTIARAGSGWTFKDAKGEDYTVQLYGLAKLHHDKAAHAQDVLTGFLLKTHEEAGLAGVKSFLRLAVANFAREFSGSTTEDPDEDVLNEIGDAIKTPVCLRE
jgi:hypothetical protein